MPDIGPKLPDDPEAEKVILSAIMSGHPETAYIFDRLRPDFLHDARHIQIFLTMHDLWEGNQALDLPAIVGRLSDTKKLERAGGVGVVSALSAPEYFTKRVDSYLERIRETAARRAIILAMERVKNLALEANEVGAGIDAPLDLALKELTGISKLFQLDTATTDRDAAGMLVASLRDTPMARAYSGIAQLDAYTGGFQAGELVILTAETGAGKTFFALQVKAESCKANQHVLLCSGEMKAPHLMGRVLAAETLIPHSKIRRPETVTPEEMQQLVEAAVRQCDKCTTLDGELSLQNIRAHALKRAHKKLLGLIIVDYDELVEIKGQETEWDEQRVLVRSLKALAMELKVPMIVVSQLRKALDPRERKQPTLQRLYGSGAKSKHASIVLYIDRPFVVQLSGDETDARVCILKNRDGRMGEVKCRFNIKTGRFEDLKEWDGTTPEQPAQMEIPQGATPKDFVPERRYVPLAGPRWGGRKKKKHRDREEFEDDPNI